MSRQQCPSPRPWLRWPENLLRRLRFCPPTTMPTGCIEFTGSISTSGYGNVSLDGRSRYTHRVAYEMVRGPITEGLFIDHLCRNTKCCNPGHLEPVTPRENVLRGRAPSAVVVRTNRCVNGHEYTPENTYVRPDGSGKRQCRICRAAADLRFKARRAAA